MLASPLCLPAGGEMISPGGAGQKTAQITCPAAFHPCITYTTLLSVALDNHTQGKKMSSESRADIGKQLSFALYGAASRMNRMHKPFLDPLGLTFPQYLVMLELFSETPRTVGDLGSRLGMDTGTITPVLKRLESAGRIVRTRDRQDERRVLITLTEEGAALQQTLWSITDSIKSACNMTDQQLAALRDTLLNFAHPA